MFYNRIFSTFFFKSLRTAYSTTCWVSHARCRESKRILECKSTVDLERVLHHSFFVSLNPVFDILESDARELSLMIVKFVLKVFRLKYLI